jgi:hypothetical protein
MTRSPDAHTVICNCPESGTSGSCPFHDSWTWRSPDAQPPTFDFDAALSVYDVDGLARLLHETSPDCRKIPVAPHERAMHANADRSWAMAFLARIWNREMEARR